MTEVAGANKDARTDCDLRRLEGAAAAAAEAASGEASAGGATSPVEAGAAGTGSGGRDEDLVHVRRHAVHGTGKEERTEADIAVRRNVPAGRIFYYPVESLRPVMLDAQRHGIRKKLFERVGRHALDAVGINAIHELLKSEDSDSGARAGYSLRRHLAREEPPEQGGN